MRKLGESLVREEANIKWHCSMIPAMQLADSDFCKRLRESGLSLVKMGLESVCPRVLHLMDKNHKDMAESEIKSVLGALKDAGVEVGLHIIFGFPTETETEARQTVDFLWRNQDLYRSCWMQPFSLEEDTAVFNRPEEYGITRIHREDKNIGRRLGYRYEVSSGMSQEHAQRFVNEEPQIISLRRTKA